MVKFDAAFRDFLCPGMKKTICGALQCTKCSKSFYFHLCPSLHFTSIHPSIYYQFIYIYISLSLYRAWLVAASQFIYLFICLSIYFLIYLCTSLSISPFLCLSVCRSVRGSVRLSIFFLFFSFFLSSTSFSTAKVFDSWTVLLGNLQAVEETS